MRRRELVSDALCDERSVELGLFDLLDVELDVGVLRQPPRYLRRRSASGAASADHDAGTGGVDVDSAVGQRVRSISIRLTAAASSCDVR